jgi:predicted phage terminase large subunit-like protein
VTAQTFRELCTSDLYWLLRYGLKRADVERQWLLDRCREVQADPNGRLDLWAREHYKSTIITFGLTIFDLLRDPNVTVGIFSHTRPIAKAFLRQIKQEFEQNEALKKLFPDVLWDQPAKEAPKWSEDEGIILKRTSNPKESSVEAWGLVDGQPTSKHFSLLVYDDVVTRESVTTPEMIKKTTEALELSFNLGAEGGHRRFIGTRYHFNDTYRTVMDRGTAKLRKHPATSDGTMEGDPVLLTRERLLEKRRDLGPYTFSSQMLQDPTADKTQGFKREWLRHFRTTPQDVLEGCTRYLLIDAANEKRKDNDYTAMWIVGLGSDGNRYCVPVLRDRLNLTERADAVFRFHRRYKPHHVRYEKYGMMADIAHIRDRMERENYRFHIDEVGGQTSKNDRIRRLVPLFEQGKVYLPDTFHYVDYEKKPRDLVQDFIEEEYAAFPVPLHDDMLDALARQEEPDLPLVWPMLEEEERPRDRYARDKRQGSAWTS